MFARLVLWELDDSAMNIDELRSYLAQESVDAFSGVEGLLLKAWISDLEGNRWGAFYLWESPEAAAGPLPSRARELIGKDAAISWGFEVDATVQGPGAPGDLSRRGAIFER